MYAYVCTNGMIYLLLSNDLQSMISHLFWFAPCAMECSAIRIYRGRVAGYHIGTKTNILAIRLASPVSPYKCWFQFMGILRSSGHRMLVAEG